MTDPKIKETLERQNEPKNPLISILQGMTVVLEDTLGVLEDVNETPELAGTQSIDAWLLEAHAFIDELAVSGLFEPMILKVQRPISTNAPEYMEQILVYNEDRSLMEQLKVDETLMSMFGDDFKMYCKARLWVDGVLQLTARCEEQEW